MLIVDSKTSVPLDVTRMDWNKSRVTITETENEHTVAIPLYDMAISEAAERFAYDIASRQPWTWPDRDDVTLSIVCDLLRSYPRFSLRVGVRPAKAADGEVPEEWAQFEARRLEAVRQHERSGGGAVFDAYPVMLTGPEEEELRRLLYDRLDIY